MTVLFGDHLALTGRSRPGGFFDLVGGISPEKSPEAPLRLLEGAMVVTTPSTEVTKGPGDRGFSGQRMLP
jgi:hypothetical protein